MVYNVSERGVLARKMYFSDVSNTIFYDLTDRAAHFSAARVIIIQRIGK